MTVTYTSEVTTSRSFSCFFKLLKRWRGSIYKIIWVDLIVFLAFYYLINIVYRIFIAIGDDHSKEIFEKIVKYCNDNITSIPLSFVLGFYVNVVMTRWWNQYTSIPYPDNLAILIGAYIKGQHERARIIRRTIVRYVCTTFTITLTMISPKVKKRFPTWQHFIDAGLLTPDETKIIEDLDDEFPSYSKYWLPLAWASNIITRVRHEGFIHDNVAITTILEELNKFRSRCGSLLDYDWISVPLVYTQVVTIATYTYFLTTSIGKQQIQSEKNENIDLYFPIFPVLEFFFYMGWLKVAETLINPFGDDDDDFEVVWMIDRHLQVCYLLVDRIHQQHPKLLRDQYWYKTAPNSLPFTVASKDYMTEYPFPSTLNIVVKKLEQDLLIEAENQVDGVPRAAGYVWRRYGRDLLKQCRPVDTTLRKVQIPNNNNRDNSTNLDETSPSPLVEPQKITYSEEFERLKEIRQEDHKRKLLKYMQLLKTTTNL